MEPVYSVWWQKLKAMFPVHDVSWLPNQSRLTLPGVLSSLSRNIGSLQVFAKSDEGMHIHILQRNAARGSECCNTRAEGKLYSSLRGPIKNPKV